MSFFIFVGLKSSQESYSHTPLINPQENIPDASVNIWVLIVPPKHLHIYIVLKNTQCANTAPALCQVL